MPAALRHLALALAAGLAACGSADPARVPEQPRPHHVLVFLVDTLRADHMAVYGYPRDTTPFLDSFGQQGVRFDRAASQSSWTAPSVISMFTGRDTAGEALVLPAELPTLPELFQAAGYRTGGFVLNPLIQNEGNGFQRGFDVFHTDKVLRRARTWIKNSKGKDTFTYIHMVTTHDPYAIDPKYHHFTGGPPLVPGEVEQRWLASAAEGMGLDPEVRAEMEQQRNRYDDDVRLMDQQFATIVRSLEANDQLADAILVLCSDHGEGLWTREAFDFSPEARDATTVEQRFKMTHGGQVYQELTRVPLMVWAPGVVGGRGVDALVGNVDLMPTLLELCDLPLPDDRAGALSGTSLARMLYAPEDEVRAAAAGTTSISTTRYQQALWEGPLKLVRPTDLGRAEGLDTELYDLVADPGETTNLAPDRPDDVARLGALLDARLAGAILSPEAELELTDANKAAMRALGYTD